MGHINYGGLVNTDRKGLIEFTRVDGTGRLDDWLVYKVPLDVDWVRGISNYTANTYPVFGRATFDVDEIGDTYINVKNYAKGYVWVNGRNLGRFWNRGPQFKLYCPGVWLKNKGNEIIVLELERPNMKPITGDTTLKI
jgi:beta-galactosidase